MQLAVTYRLADRAEADLAAIWDYSAEQWSTDQADRYVDELIRRFAWLRRNRALWTSQPDLAEGLYSYPRRSHVIFFRLGGELPDRIEIVRVLHRRMEPAKHI